MRLTNICALVALVWLSAGLVTGLWVQAELFSPGVRGDVAAKKALFDAAIPLHGMFLQMSLPLAAGLAMGLALLAEKRRRLAGAIAAGSILLGSAIMPAVLIAVLVLSRQYTLGVSYGSDPLIMLGIPFVGLLAAWIAVPEARLAMLPAGIAGMLSLALVGFLSLILANAGEEGVVDETYFMSALDHACGLTQFLWSFAVMLGWARRDKPVAAFWPAVPIAFLALVTGGYLVLSEVRLGLLGMPRHYIDYADVFFQLHRLASWAGFAFAFSMVAGAGFLIYLKCRPQPPVSGEFD